MVGMENGIAQQFRVNTFNLIAKREVNTNQIKSLYFQAVRFQYIKHILEELYPVYSVHPLLLCSVKTTTNRASITYTYISSVIKLWNLPT